MASPSPFRRVSNFAPASCDLEALDKQGKSPGFGQASGRSTPASPHSARRPPRKGSKARKHSPAESRPATAGDTAAWSPEKETDRDPRNIVKSLQIHHDARYMKMDFYRHFGGTNATEGTFTRLVGQNRKMNGHNGGNLPSVGKDLSPQQLAELEIEFPDPDGWEAPRSRRLFDDLDMTGVPSARLGHLDRMHAWFREHGAKQARKAKQGPNFLRFSRNCSEAEAPAGSTRSILRQAKPGGVEAGFNSVVVGGSYVKVVKNYLEQMPK
eukprot:TRINITY_DN73506_c0_g1_i1.p1 TRINITY_DN73506_c0_g1~~TRINITY_DN73506_c0_g1_i1.p1  ORF type:complete len:268 (+),score=56.84 TRINITY_DN73506_c0_g1_i1:90-893(+)